MGDVAAQHSADVAAILAKRGHNGGDQWATPDGRLYVGSPYSTLSSLGMLHELGIVWTRGLSGLDGLRDDEETVRFSSMLPQAFQAHIGDRMPETTGGGVGSIAVQTARHVVRT